MNKFTLALILAGFFSSPQTYAQATTFVSALDQEINLKTVAVLPMNDNLSGIYSKPLGQELIHLVDSDSQWARRDIAPNAQSETVALTEKPEQVKQILKKISADALIEARLTKGPLGISLILNLFSAKDGLLMAQSNIQSYQGYEITDLKSLLKQQYQSLKSKIPYDGLILSRKENLVTLNIGKQQGLQENQDLNVIQIVKMQRHPRFHFITSTEKEILGRIKISKIEENLSFGSVTSERGPGVVQPGQKIIVEQFVHYNDTPEIKDAPIAFGEKPKEWIPEKTASFGKIGILVGLSQYTLSSSLATSGGLSAGSSFAPTIQLNGEIWMNPEWFMDVLIRQYIFNISNPGSGSPGKLNVSTSQYAVSGGYNFLVAEKFFGPKIQLLAGYSKFSSAVDQASPLTSFTNQTYSGLMFGLGGSFPLELEHQAPISIGARLNFFLNPALDEAPVDSGTSSNTITSFAGYVEYGYSPRLNIKGQLNYDLFSSSFSGTGSRGEIASSSSHAITTLSGGIEYLF